MMLRTSAVTYICWGTISPEGIIYPVWFNRYSSIYYWKQFLNNVIMNKTKILFPQA
jgi:hypothetical protein